MVKILFGLMALALLAVPAIAVADSVQPFTASGNICLTELPQIVAGSPRPTGVRIVAVGEKLAGIIEDSYGWEDLEGATVDITITREESFFNFITKTFSGRIKGSLTVTTANGVSTGALNGTVSGAFLDPENILDTITGSSAQVNWGVTGTAGKAWGNGNATFAAALDGTFCGPLDLAGSVEGELGGDREESYSDGKHRR